MATIRRKVRPGVAPAGHNFATMFWYNVKMKLSGYINCELCNREEWEKSIQNQNDHYLCFQCNGSYDDEELEEKLNRKKDLP